MMIVRYFVAGAATILVGLIGVACMNTPLEGPVDAVSGDFPLVSFNGNALPADMGTLPPDRSSGTPSPCRMFVDQGTLSIDSSTQRFSYAYTIRESCAQRVMSSTNVAGLYSQVAERLGFTVVAADTTFRFSGEVRPQRILVTRGETLEFQR
jgi:hypothetical protein